MQMPFRATIGVAVVLAVVVPTASAQGGFRPAVAAVASTFGFGAEGSLDGRRIGVRVGYTYLGGPELEREVEGIRYTVEPRLRHARAVVDVYPFANGFRLSGGLVLNRARAHGVAVLTEPITIGNRTYQPSEVGQVRGEAFYQRDVMPFLGLGIVTGGRVGFLIDLGIGFAGRPAVDLVGETNLTGAELQEFEQNIAREETEISQAIADEPLAKFYPILAIGLRFRF